MTAIGIILGSTRPGRNGEVVATWVLETAAARNDATFELVDLRDHPLPPHLDEPPGARPPGGSAHPAIQTWAETIARFDGFIMITPEYNYAPPGIVKIALDTLYSEWNNKAVGFVSYGAAGGARATQHLRSTCGALQMADVAAQVTLHLQTEFAGGFNPTPASMHTLDALIDQVLAWSNALAAIRG